MKLDSLQSLEILHKKNNSTEYQGELDNYQQNGSKQNRESQKKFEHYEFTPYQNLLYKRALFGLTVYTEEELKTMNPEKKERIKKVNRKAQQVLNIFKQEIVNNTCENIFLILVPKSEFAKKMLTSEKIGTDPNFINILNLKDLGINKIRIVNRFIKEGLLPSNFFELKELA